MRPSGRHKDSEREQTAQPQEINGLQLRSNPKNFSFAVNQRQTEVKSEYRKRSENSMPNITSLVMWRRPSPF
jgi:hypothetical protein